MKLTTDELNVLNYSDIFFSCYSDNERGCWGLVEDHTLVYVCSGEMFLQEAQHTIKIRRGECVFLRKDHRVSLTKQPKGKEKFIGISLVFKRAFLRKFYQTIDKKKLPLQVFPYPDQSGH